MTTQLPSAGWYPDPTGKPGQKYWDGQAWTDIPAPEIPATPKAGWYPDPTDKPGQKYWDGQAWTDIPAPEIPATPKAATPPPPLGHRPGRQLAWPLIALGIITGVVGYLVAIPLLYTIGLIALVVGLVLMAVGRMGSATPKAAGALSGNKLFILIMAGLVATGVLVGVTHEYLYKFYCTHMPTCRYYPPSSRSPSSPDSQQSRSPYYQEGYNSGTSGLARNGYGDDMYNTGATVAEMEHNACSAAINNEPNYASIQDADQPGNQDDYMNGCLNAFRDHPPAAKPKPGPLNPYR